MPRSKYATEEERKAARREYMRKYREEHKEEIRAQKREQQRRYYQKHKEERREYDRKRGHAKSAVGFEVLSVEDLDELSKAPTDMSERVISDMNIDFIAEHRQKFIQMLRDNEQTDELLNKAFDLARKSICLNNSRKGSLFESVIRKNLLYELRMKQQKLYSQIPINKNSCRIDFALSNEVVDDKTKLDLSQAVIISTKTSLCTHWREDQHLYSSCKAYVMVTLDSKCPTEKVPNNVYFCSPHYTSNGSNIINLNDLLPTVMEYLEPEDSDEDTNEDTDLETNEDTDEEQDEDTNEDTEADTDATEQ